MIDFSRTKSFDKTFVRVRVDEEDMAFFARKIAGSLKDREDNFEIEIRTTDKDTYRTRDPNFFTSDHMPKQIRSVEISHADYKDKFQCRLVFGDYRTIDQIEGQVLLIVRGRNEQITPLFQDLEKELLAKQIFGQWIVRGREKIWLLMVAGLIVAAAVYSAFDLGLDLWRAFRPGFDGSTTHIFLQFVGFAAIVVSFFASPSWIQAKTRKHFPPVEFAGRLAGPRRKAQKIMYWLVLFAVIPILVNIFSSLLVDAIKLWMSTRS